VSQNPFWQISTGDLFDLLQPAAYALAALVSACVMADALRRRLSIYAVAAWTLATFFLPLVAAPLYLAFILSRRRETPFRDSSQNSSVSKPDGDVTEPRDGAASPTPAPGGANRDAARVSVQHSSQKRAPRRALKVALPIFYFLFLLTLGGLLFRRDYASVEAHLARAAHARVRDQHERAAREYKAALQLEENPHTRKLLGVELMHTGRTPEALEEFKAAERAGDDDPQLPFRIAQALDLLKRRDEAVAYYRRFLEGESCTKEFADQRCLQAQARLSQK
jgi:hypothetical protein